jgi:hypothetical protein
MNSFFSKYKTVLISGLLAVLFIVVAFLFIHWEVERVKARSFEKAKEVIATPEKASKIAGRALFDIKNFKNKMSEEVKRLEDSTKNHE